jgi:hypothetical protein
VSFAYELVLSLDLKDGLPDSVVDETRWLFGIGPASPDAALDHGWQLAESDVTSLPGGEFTSLEREYRFDTPSGPVFAQALFVRRHVGDDVFADCITPLLEWVARIAVNGYVGFFRTKDRFAPTVIFVRNGHAYINSDDGTIGAATMGAPPFS